MIRRALDLIYAASGGLAVSFLAMIAVLTLAQIAARVMGTIVPSADDFAGFCMAGAVFLGLTYTLRVGGHIRVLTMLTHMPRTARPIFELACAGSAALVIAALVYYTVDMIISSRQIGEYTIGLVPLPKWIPMLLMLVGLSVFLMALIDAFVQLARGDKPTYIAREEEQASSVPTSAE